MKLALKFVMPLVTLFAIVAPAHAEIIYKMTVNGLTDAVGFRPLSFAWGVSNAAAANPLKYSGQRGTISGLTIEKFFDNYSPSLESACFQGTQYSSLELIGVDFTGTPIIDIVMTKVMVSSDSLSASNELPDEAVAFSAAKITINGVTINPASLADMQKANQMIAAIMRKANSKTTVK